MSPELIKALRMMTATSADNTTSIKGLTQTVLAQHDRMDRIYDRLDKQTERELEIVAVLAALQSQVDGIAVRIGLVS